MTKTYETNATLHGEIVFSKQHVGTRGGVNVYFIQEIEEWEKDGKTSQFKHSFLAKQFFMNDAKSKPSLVANGTKVIVSGNLKTEVRKDEKDDTKWITTTFVEITKPIALK